MAKIKDLNFLLISIIITCVILGGIFYNKKIEKTQPNITSEPLISVPDVIEQVPEVEKPNFEITNKKFKGSWNTTKGKILDGIMTCNVNTVDQKTWQGTFFGTWNGVDFSYDVNWSGPMERLTGQAVVDGVNYQWQGSIDNNGNFKGTFESPRYDGYFNLKAL